MRLTSTFLNKIANRKINMKYIQKKLGEKRFILSRIWKINFFVILFYVKIFVERMKSNAIRLRFSKLSHMHYEIINDNSIIHKEIDSTKKLKLSLAEEYCRIVRESHSNKLKMKISLLYFGKLKIKITLKK